MRAWRVLGILAALATTGSLAAAPASAASSAVQVPLGSLFNAMVFVQPNTPSPQGQSNSACRTTNGATFGNNHGLNAGSAPTGTFTPPGSPVSFKLGPLNAKDAICIRDAGTAPPSQPTSVTIPVPSGQYTDAYFIASVAHGPSLVSITPVYTTGDGTALTAYFDDWCAPVLTNGSLTPDSTPAWPNPGNRPVNSSGSASSGLACTVWNTHVPGLDPSKTLTALKITQAPPATAFTPGPGLPSNGAEPGNAVLNILALTLEAASASSPAASTSSTAASSTAGGTPSSSTLPKTGGNQTGIVIGVGLFAAGAWLGLRRRPAPRAR